MKSFEIKKFDMGVVGTSLQSAMIAGVLAKEHKKKTCLFLSKAVQHQVAQEVCFSFNFATRPETWDRLKSAISESLPLITSIGGAPAITRTSATLICQSEEWADMLAHMYHYLHGIDYQIERLSREDFPTAKALYKIRDIKLVRRNVLWPAMFSWLASLGVEIFEPNELEINPRRDGSSNIKLANAQIDVDRLVLADESAIIAHASTTALNQLFIQLEGSAILTLPKPNISEQIVFNPQNGFCARMRKEGSVEAISHMPMDQMGQLLRNNIREFGPSLLSGRALVSRLVTKDGAPIVGKLGRSSVWGIAGFGPAGIFYTHALARQICEVPASDELSYFSSRRGDKSRNSAEISEGCVVAAEAAHGD